MAETTARTFLAALEVFRQGVTLPSYFHLVIISVGWVLTPGTHAVTEALVVTGVSGIFHHEAFHRFFSRASWDPDVMGHWLFLRLRRVAGGLFRIVIDDTLAAKKGPEIFGIGTHIDPVRSTRKFKVFAFGHVFVTLCVLVEFPFSRSPWALPVLFRLYRQKKECRKHRGAYRTKNELALELLRIFAKWCPTDARIDVMADSAYCCSTVTRGLPKNMVLTGAMRLDAVLTALPPPRQKGKPGRSRKRGALLQKPSALASDDTQPWLQCEAWTYGRVATVKYKTFVGQWYRACGARLLRIVVVQCTSGSIPIRVFFSTDNKLSVAEILNLYSTRWTIEVCFRNLKQLFGFADSIARKRAAVERTAPFIGLLYSLLVLWYAEYAVNTPLATFPNRPWYPWKKDVCFADVLRAAQHALRGVSIADLLRTTADFQHPRYTRPPLTTEDAPKVTASEVPDRRPRRQSHREAAA